MATVSFRIRSRVASFLILGIVALVPATALAVCTEPALFGPPTSITTGSNPRAVAVNDFNEDGILDLAVSNCDYFGSQTNGSVAILLGNGTAGVGNGTFATPVPYPMSGTPFSVAPADFNGDGILDLAAALWSTNRVAILLGQGSGGVGNGAFGTPTVFPAGRGAFEIATGDFDGDNDIDLAVVNNPIDSITVLLGTGNGTFDNPTRYHVDGPTSAIAAGQLNGDGDLDLVVACNYSGTLSILLGGAGATFNPAPSVFVGGEPFELVLADFDEDGELDIATANGASGGVSFLRGLGGAAFAGPVISYSGNNVGGIDEADVDQDGVLDLLVTQVDLNRAVLLRGQGVGAGNGSFQFHSSYALAGYPQNGMFGDFDEDGMLDFAVGRAQTQSISILPGTCEAAPPPPSDAPHLDSVKDVANDQGGKVFLRWTRSRLDTPGPITGYRVWRRLPLEAANAQITRERVAELTRTEEAGPDGILTVYWEALVTLPAQGLEGYGYTAPTTQDSLRNSNPYTAFFVTALTSNPNTFYSSNVDSGYSVDNLPPHGPQHLVAQVTSGGIALEWDANQEADLDSYRLYRGGDPDFVPSESNLIATVEEPGYLDAEGVATVFYKLTAVDSHGNEGAAATAGPSGATGVEGGTSVALAIHGSHPNPAVRGRIVIRLSLPSAGRAQLELFDVLGRRAAVREVGTLGPGTHEVTLGERGRIPIGIYLVRLVQGGRSVQAKVAVIS